MSTVAALKKARQATYSVKRKLDLRENKLIGATAEKEKLTKKVKLLEVSIICYVRICYMLNHMLE